MKLPVVDGAVMVTVLRTGLVVGLGLGQDTVSAGQAAGRFTVTEVAASAPPGGTFDPAAS